MRDAECGYGMVWGMDTVRGTDTVMRCDTKQPYSHWGSRAQELKRLEVMHPAPCTLHPCTLHPA